MKRISEEHIILALKGAAMGAANVVPGVSGGTIAFITGIYSRLVGAIAAFDREALGLLVRMKIGKFWKHLDGGFLLSLGFGIVFSIFSLAKLMTWCLGAFPVATWGFFFGLILASGAIMLKGTGLRDAASALLLLLGTALGAGVCLLSPASTPDSWWMLMICGALGMIAMILPGISGSFIFVILGKYAYIMEAVSEFRIVPIIFLAAGAVAGLLAFARALKALMNRWERQTLLVMTGFTVGSLVKVWPWPATFGTAGLTVSIGPSAEALAGGLHIAQGIVFILLGAGLIATIEIWKKRQA